MSSAGFYSEEQLVQVLGKPAFRGDMPRWNPKFGVDTRPPPPPDRPPVLYMSWQCISPDPAQPLNATSDAQRHLQCGAVSAGSGPNGKRQWFLVNICGAHSDKVGSLLKLAKLVDAVNNPTS